MPRSRRSGGEGYIYKAFRRHVYRIENLSTSTEDEVVHFLRSNYPFYRRMSDDALRCSVRKLLSESPPPNPLNTSVSSSSTSVGYEEGEASRKKPRRGNETKERLQRMEIARLRPSQEPEGSDESEESKSDDDEIGETSDSEDVIYDEKMEPEFDLMNSMIRDSYKEKPKEKEEEDNVEMELPVREKVAMTRTVVPRTGVPVHRANAKRDSGKISGSIDNAGDAKRSRGPLLSDLAGMNAVLEELETEVLVPLCQPEVNRWLGTQPVSGILLHGPPGCGKTQLAHAIANETGVPFYKISATDIGSGVSGASEENLRELFTKAHRTAPSIIFIDEIDAIGAKRENLDRGMEKRILTQLLTCMADSHTNIEPSDGNLDSKHSESTSGFVLVIGATNRPDALEPALRRPGRFDWEIFIKVPDESARLEILSLYCKKLRLERSFDLLKIAKSTPGFVGADLKAVANKAGNLARNRFARERKSKRADCGESCDNQKWYKKPWLREEIERLSVTVADFEEAVKVVQPSTKREGFSEIPEEKWEGVGGLDNLRKEFKRHIVWRIKCPEDYEEFGLNLETSILLYGPPGCGKTLIAKAVANEAGASFIHVKGPELLNKYVGESERAVRTLFSRARTCAPCIIFFDEVDALTTNRQGREGRNVVGCVNQLLVELDGAKKRRGVYVIGATNRPQLLDKAIIRPGRFGKLLYVPLPSPAQRTLILEATGRKMPLDASVDLNEITHMEACENFSGADLHKLMNEAAMAAYEERQASVNPAGIPFVIKMTHFELALKNISPSVSIQENKSYEKLRKTFK